MNRTSRIPFVLSLTIVALLANTLAADAPYGAGSAEIVGASLVIDGTQFGDHCSIDLSGDNFLVVLNGKSRELPAAGVTSIQFSGEEGDDFLTNNTNIETTATGGAGDDFLKTTRGVGIFYGGTGNDFLVGGPQGDVLSGGFDDDVIVCSGGDDQVSGDATGAGPDTVDVDAQLVGDEAFARGQFVQIGISGKGTFGAAGAAIPAGYTDTGADGRSGFNNLFGFIADTGMDGFEDGDYDGDYFTPGTPEEGFAVEIDGINYNNNSSTSFAAAEIPGVITGASTGETADVTWEGSINGLDVKRDISVFENGLFIRISVDLTNNSGGTLDGVYFMNNVDPDNDVTLHGSYSTFNTIVSQGDTAADNLSLVTAQQDIDGPGVSGGFEATGSAVALVSFDPRARVSYGGFSNRIASDVYNGSGGLTGTVGSTNTADEGISLAFNVGDMADGESTTLVYYYSLDPTGFDICGITDIDGECADPGVPGNDSVYGGTGNDLIATDEGDDLVVGGAGNDVVMSGDGEDTVFGQNGDDTIETGRGNDRAYGGGGADNIFTASGDDIAFGDGGDDDIRGGNGDDFINGGSGFDTLNGQGGNDRIRGAAGNDFLNGGIGIDDLAGGGGIDVEINASDPTAKR